MKQINNYYINNIEFNKQYYFTSFTSFINYGYNIQHYYASQSQYIGIHTMLRQYEQDSYKLNSQSYYVIDILYQDIGDKILQNSISLSCNNIVYNDGGNNILYKSGTYENYGNIIYQSGLIIITSKSLIDDLNTYQWDYLQYKTVVNVHQYNLYCNIKSYQYNYSTNPSLYTTQSVLKDQFTSSYNPYITSVRIYDNDNNHILTTTLSHPLKKNKDSDQTIHIKFLKYL